MNLESSKEESALLGESWSIPTEHQCPQGKAGGIPRGTTDDYDSTTRLKHLIEKLHDSGAGSLRPQIYDATTELDDKIRLRVFPGSRNVQEPTGSPQEVPHEIQKEIPQENSEKHPDNMFKVINYTRKNLRTLILMEQDIKKLTSQITDAGCQDIADIVKVKDTIEELELPENTNSDPSVRWKRLRKRRRPSTTL